MLVMIWYLLCLGFVVSGICLPRVSYVCVCLSRVCCSTYPFLVFLLFCWPFLVHFHSPLFNYVISKVCVCMCARNPWKDILVDLWMRSDTQSWIGDKCWFRRGTTQWPENASWWPILKQGCHIFYFWICS